jgi:prepilin-type N-terminal cleavage/methylation domain-containing protein
MKRGFTLAELLIALALTALAVAIMSEGVRRTIDFQARLEESRTDRETLIAASAALRSRLERLVPAIAEPASEEAAPRLLFAGSSESLVFIAADPGYPSRAGLYEYRLTLISAEAEDNDTGTPVMVLRRRPITELADFGQATGTAFQSWDLPLSGDLVFRYGTSPDQLQASWQQAGSYPGFVALVATNDEQPLMITPLPRLRPEGEDAPVEQATP